MIIQFACLMKSELIKLSNHLEVETQVVTSPKIMDSQMSCSKRLRSLIQQQNKKLLNSSIYVLFNKDKSTRINVFLTAFLFSTFFINEKRTKIGIGKNLRSILICVSKKFQRGSNDRKLKLFRCQCVRANVWMGIKR